MDNLIRAATEEMQGLKADNADLRADLAEGVRLLECYLTRYPVNLITPELDDKARAFVEKHKAVT